MQTVIKNEGTKISMSSNLKPIPYDIEARKKFYSLVVEHIPKEVKIKDIDDAVGNHRFSTLKSGTSYIPVDKLPILFAICGIKKNSDLYNELTNLELSCIAGRHKDKEFEKYERIYGGSALKKNKYEVNEKYITVLKEEDTIILHRPANIHERNCEARREFGEILEECLPENMHVSDLSKILFNDIKALSELKRGNRVVLVDMLPKIYEICGIEKGSDVFIKLLELELLSITGVRFENEYNKFPKVFDFVRIDPLQETIDEVAIPVETTKTAEKEGFNETITGNSKPVKTIVLHRPADSFKKDIGARREFHDILKKCIPEGMHLTNLSEILGNNKYFLKSLRKGNCFVPVDKLPIIFKLCNVKIGDNTFIKLLELELLSIKGACFEYEYNKFPKVFNCVKIDQSVEAYTEPVIREVVVIETATENSEEKEEKMIVTDTPAENNNYDDEKKEFCTVLTHWLFKNGYTFTNAAESIGCSEKEFEQVINGEICLSPYHVNRFSETLHMDDDIVHRLVEIAGHCYKGDEIPEGLLKYISSDSIIIKTLEAIREANKPASFWQKIYDELTLDSFFDF